MQTSINENILKEQPTSQGDSSVRILVDADSIYFRMAMASQRERDIRVNIIRLMKEIERECSFFCENVEMYVAIKGKGNFRHELYDDYKGQRPDLEPEIKKALTYGHQFMQDRYNAVMADGMEADDLVSIWAYECMKEDAYYVIAGIDKDLLQIPGNHYNFVKKEHQYVDTDTGHLKLMLQCLTGDNADNIPGIKGIGPKKAEKILAGVPADRRWDRVVAAWNEHRAGDPYLSYKLLRMLTSWEDYEEIRSDIERGGKAADESPSETSECEQDVPESGTSREMQDEGLQHLSESDKGEVGVHPVAVQGESAS